ncbi:MAG: c-type cytochrome [Rhodanobacteraceae bacterium]
MQQRSLTIFLFALAAVFASSAAFASGDVAAGKQKAQAVCAACHGMDGTHTADGQYPRLAGQYEDYLVQALHEYQNGARQHPAIGLSRGNAIMQGMAAPLSDEDINNVAAYFSSLPGTLSDLHGKVQGGN